MLNLKKIKYINFYIFIKLKIIYYINLLTNYD